jgi:hypothetical protein
MITKSYNSLPIGLSLETAKGIKQTEISTHWIKTFKVARKFKPNKLNIGKTVESEDESSNQDLNYQKNNNIFASDMHKLHENSSPKLENNGWIVSYSIAGKV